MSKLLERLKHSKAFSAFMALVLAVSAMPVQAFAAEAADRPMLLESGTCTITCTNNKWVNGGDTTFAVSMPDGQVLSGHCLNPGWPTPVDGAYSYTATPIGGGVYSVTVNSSYVTSDINRIHPFDRGHMVGSAPWKTQAVGATWVKVQYGKLSIHKVSSNPGLTDGNALYSLQGAQYGVFADPGCTNQKATLTLDASGNATSGDLETGTYYVKETKAGEGYTIDPTVYTVNVSANTTTPVNGGTVSDTPINDPVGVLVGKFDGENKYNANNLPQGSASLKGAEFTVRYYDGFYDTKEQAEASGAPTRTWVFATDEDGFALLDPSYQVAGDPLYEMNGLNSIPRGTILIQETKAPEGYFLNDEVFVQKIKQPGDTSNETTYNESQIPEEIKRGGLSVQKLDAETGKTPQGDASLKGIAFAVINDSGNAVRVDGKSYAPGETVKTIVTNDDGYAATSADALPFGDYIIRETATNDSYLNTAEDIHATVSEDGKVYSYTASNNVVRGGVKVSKRDLESGLSTALGSATLDGTRFEIRYLGDKPVIVDGASHSKNQVVKTLTIKDGEASTSADLLPYGTYSLQEVAVGDGYLLTDGTAYKFTIREDGAIVNPVTGGVVKNQVKRGDLELVKVREDDMSRLAGVPFRITSNTTGESHVLVTDEMGIASTSAEWNKHTANTNFNDTAADGTYDASAGIWFGKTTEGGTVAPNDSLGALPYDTYTVEELRCEANEGLNLVKFENVVIKRDSVTIDLGTIDDIKPYIHTTARDGADGDKLVHADDQALITDHVEYTGLKPNTRYTITATLMEKESGKALPGTEVTKEFTPSAASGSVEMEIPVDLIDYAGKDVVVFEVVKQGGEVVAEHKDLDDTEQKVRVTTPKIGTTARDGADGDHSAVIDPETVIVDTVSYKNLVPGREYKVTGKLMDKATGEALEVDGKPVTSEAVFTPEDSNGTVDVTFGFDGSALEGKSVVVFETLYRSDREIAAHADIDDEGQTIEFTKPQVGTTAKDGVDGDQHGTTDPEAVIVDTVAYRGLIPGREYRVAGKLMDKKTGKPLEIGGEPVTSEAVFTPDLPNGTVDVTFKFDSTGLDGAGVVVFETLYRNDVEIAAHADIEDEGQTVEYEKPSIGTTAKDAADGDQQAVIDPETVIVDTVSYTGLVPGKEYTVKGKLMDKATGEALKVDGEAVTAEAAFVPDHPNGTVDVTFNFDSSALSGKSTVVFETLYRNGIEITAHADIEDAGQTIEFTTPEIGTTATDGIDGDHAVVADREVTVVDTVSYTGLVPGKEYTVKGKLMDRATGEPLKVDGEAVTAEAAFVPDHHHGTVDVTFTFDASMLAGQQFVAFETLYRLDREITAHADIEDEGQTVSIIQPAVDTAAIDKTSQSKEVTIDPEAVITDKVFYDRVIPGGEYTAYGIVMDASTGLPLLSDAEGEEVSEQALGEFWQKLVDLSGVHSAEPLSYEKPAEGLAGVLAAIEDFSEQCHKFFNGGVAEEGADEEQAEVWFPPATPDWDGIEKLLEENPEIAGRLVTASSSFKPEESYGELSMDFDLDATKLAGRTAVVFELLVKDGMAVAAHADADDADQSVSFVKPTIGTTALDGIDMDKDVVADTNATVTDTIAYKGLVPGKEYTVKGTLMDKETGEPLTDAEGNPVTSEAAFTPDKTDGTVEVVFTFDASMLAGQQFVAFETLYRNGKEIVSHADIEDEGQTVGFIQTSVDTVAIDGIDGDKNVVADPEAKITDTLSYKDAIPGSTYEMHGILMDAESGLPLLTGEGASDITEEELTEFWQQLIDLTGTHSMKPLESPGILDAIASLFTGGAQEQADTWFPPVTPDWEGIKALLAKNPQITACLSITGKEFEADKASGEVAVSFDLDASELAGRNVVVFELLVKDGMAVAAHADLSDADQTVAVVPSTIGTEATDKTDGDHEAIVSKEATIVDTVTYENLIPGKEYTIEGVLMDKSTGKPLMVDDKQVEAKASFTPNHASGTVELEFTFDASALAGKEVVAFEHLYKDGIEVAAHADINDAAQTVKFVAPPKGSVYDKTGNMLAKYGWVVALVAIAAVGGAAYAGAQYRKSRREQDASDGGNES